MDSLKEQAQTSSQQSEVIAQEVQQSVEDIETSLGIADTGNLAPQSRAA